MTGLSDQNMSLHQLAPAGTPIGLADLADGLLGQHGGTPSLELFRSDICQRYGVRHCFFVSTGRAAFAIALRALRELGPQDRDEVLIPSYTCYSVPASVARAGLKIRVCDVDSATLDYDPQTLDRVDFSRVLCVASANLYGIPNDLGRLRTIADRHGAFLLDDAAQSMEAKVGGEYSGTLGDVGFFSLDKGKNITTIDGGILVTNKDDIAARIGAIVAQLPPPSAGRRLAYLAKLLVYSGFLHPRMYWLPESLPFLRLGTTPYPHDIDLRAYPAFLAGVGRRLFARIAELTAARVANARFALDALQGQSAIQPIRVAGHVAPVYLRLPLLVRAEQRDRAVEELKQAGIGASASYPTAVPDIPGIDPALFRGPIEAEGGRGVAKRILTLPTHPYVERSSLERAVTILAAGARAGCGVPAGTI